MTKQLKIAIIFFLLTWLTSNVALAQTYPTNLSGVVVKKVRCSSNNIWLTLVNRSNQSLVGKILNIKVFDEDNDPIGNCKGYEALTVGPKSGDSVFVPRCNCSGFKSISVRIQ